MLNWLELTGRAATHVTEAAALGCALHPETLEPLLRMQAEARGVGIELAVVSGFRDFARQLAIWNAKFRGERPLLDRNGEPLDRAQLDDVAAIDAILLWSALPGASRHHWGTDIDLIDRAALPPGYCLKLSADEFAPSGIFAHLSTWLGANMGRFGFFRPYTQDQGGVQPEAWHLSFAPIAVPALQALTLDVLSDALANSEIEGRDLILQRLPQLHERFVRAVDAPRWGTSIYR